jgi:hypothetical protein
MGLKRTRWDHLAARQDVQFLLFFQKGGEKIKFDDVGLCLRQRWSIG